MLRINVNDYVPFQVVLVDGVIADWALAPCLLTQRKVVQYTRPAVDVATMGHLRCKQTKRNSNCNPSVASDRYNINLNDLSRDRFR